jgi:excisionase family DNA binding protein
MSVFTIAEIAKKLRISPACAYALIESGQLPCYRIGIGRGTIRVSDEQLQVYLAANTVKHSLPSAAKHLR